MMPFDVETFIAHGLDRLPENDYLPKPRVHPTAMLDDNQYNPCAEASSRSIPRGKVQKIRDWRHTEIFPNTNRDIWIYTPPEFNPQKTRPALAFFNDGAGYVHRAGPVRAPAVFDSLIHTKELPPIVGIFVNPGMPDEPVPDGSYPDRGRSYEYDSVSPRYVKFINDELVPLVESTLGCEFNPDPRARLICGMSSGGICAFNAAWHDASAFGLVLSHCGSFTNIRGGHNYPYLVRTSVKKPIRVFLQSGKHDLDNWLGNWPLANQQMATALQFADYEYRFVYGEGMHSLRHAGAIFADSLRWLFGAE
jgi:enterochelin esterase family protein